MLPVLRLLELYASHVLINPVLEQVHALHRARLLMNLGLKEEGTALHKAVEQNKFSLGDEERKVQYEKIKALKDGKDKDNDHVAFQPESAHEPFVIDGIRVHESWVGLSEELMKWGEFTRAKVLAKEASLHASILKD